MILKITYFFGLKCLNKYQFETRKETHFLEEYYIKPV